MYLIILVLPILFLLSLMYMRFEAGFLKITQVDLSKGKKNLKILHISDIHIGLMKVSHKKIQKVIRSQSPDVIVMTGDYVDTTEDIEAFLKLLEVISIKNKTLVSLGNHDFSTFNRKPNEFSTFIAEIEKRGVTVLQNRCKSLKKGSQTYDFIGISDIRFRKDDIEKALMGVSNKSTRIMLCHNPDTILKLSKGQVEYILCGHFHGGQIYLPFNLEFRLLRREKMAIKGMIRGLHFFNGFTIYINRGLGNVLFPLRFFSRPEIAIIYLA